MKKASLLIPVLLCFTCGCQTTKTPAVQQSSQSTLAQIESPAATNTASQEVLNKLQALPENGTCAIKQDKTFQEYDVQLISCKNQSFEPDEIVMDMAVQECLKDFCWCEDYAWNSPKGGAGVKFCSNNYYLSIYNQNTKSSTVNKIGRFDTEESEWSGNIIKDVILDNIQITDNSEIKSLEIDWLVNSDHHQQDGENDYEIYTLSKRYRSKIIENSDAIESNLIENNRKDVAVKHEEESSLR